MDAVPTSDAADAVSDVACVVIGGLFLSDSICICEGGSVAAAAAAATGDDNDNDDAAFFCCISEK